MEASKNGLERIMTCMDKLRELKAKAQAGDMTAAETEKWQRLTGSERNLRLHGG